MQTFSSHLPDSPSLAFGIASVLNLPENVKIVDRQFNQYTSTFPSEIVTCELADNTRIKLFCKYETERFRNDDRERGGIEYEAAVYE